MLNKDFRKWYILATCCGLSAGSVGICLNSSGVFFLPVSSALGIGIGQFALQTTISSILIGSLSTLTIRIIRKYNAKGLISAGIIVAGMSTALMSRCESITCFYVLGALRGIGCSLFSLVVITYIIGNWFTERQGFAIGTALSFSGLAGAFFSPLFSHFIERYGWRETYQIAGLCIILLALPGTLLFLEKEPSPAVRETSNVPTQGKNTNRTGNRGIAKSAPVFFVTVSLLSFFVPALTGMAQHFPGYAVSLGYSLTTGSLMISAVMMGNIIFKVLLGYISDKTDPVRAVMAMLILNSLSVACLLVLYYRNGSSIWILSASFLFGTVYAVGTVGISLIVRDIFGADGYVSVYPVMYLLISIGNAASLTINGYLFDYTGSYGTNLTLAASMGILCLLLLAIIRQIRFGKSAVSCNFKEFQN